jgi:hypothetical protein
MQLILAILLYLRVIVSPGTYTEKHIDLKVEENRARIEAIQSDKPLLEKIQNEYGPSTEFIVIVANETD